MKTLPDDTQRLLRQNGLMRETEIAFEADDLIIIEDISSRARRTITALVVRQLFEGSTNRTLLKG